MELLQKFGGNAWRYHNFQLEAETKILQAQLEVVQKDINNVNKKRKAGQVDLSSPLSTPTLSDASLFSQLEALSTLSSLQSRLVDLRGASYRVEAACTHLDARVEQLRKKAKPEGEAPAASTETSHHEQE